MSRIGNLPIEIPSGITVEVKGNTVVVRGSAGELSQEIDPRIKVEINENVITVSRTSEIKEVKSLHGLSRSLIANMIEGVEKGYEKKLEILGVGYRAQVSGKKITLSLGFSHPVEYTAPEGITIEQDQENKNILSIKGIDKQKVGQVAAEIRAFKKPEPYKGKGIRYQGEYVRRKAGKAASKGE